MNLAGPWPVRAIWAVLPLALGPALDAAFGDRSRPVALLLAAVAWAAWTGGIVAVLVPRTVGLTFLRVAAPTGLGLAIWAAVVSGDSAGTAMAALAVGAATVATVVMLAPTTGDLFVNGSAYGPERRFALRTPAALLFGPIQLVWALLVAGALTGPLLLAAEVWVGGVVATVVGFPVAALASRSLHQLARRWLVFVPAGMVVHDPTVVATQLFPRSSIRRFGPAPHDTAAYDLTWGAPGLALQLELVQPVLVEPTRRLGAAPVPTETDRLLVSPTRPGAVLREAAARRLPVGT